MGDSENMFYLVKLVYLGYDDEIGKLPSYQ